MVCLSCIPLYGLVLAGLIIAYQIYRFYIRPNSKLQQYRNQGLPVIFAPFSGYLKQVGIDLQKHGDMYYTWKQLNTLNPKPKAFASNFGDKPVVALKDPELIKQFFMAQEKNYIKAQGAVGVAKLILRNGTLLSEGAVWKAHRKLTSPIYSYDLLKERIQEYVQLADAGWERLKTKDLKKVNFLKEVQSINLEIAGKLFLDIELHKLEFKGQTVSGFVSELIDRSALEALDPFTVIFGTNIVKHGLISRQKTLVQDINDLRGFLYGAAKAKLGEVLAAKANGTSTTKLPLFLELLFEQKQKLTQEDLDEVDLVDEFANFVLGTMDTTAHSIIFASYFHLITPNSQKKLVEEVDRVFKNPSSVTLDTLNGMDYMNAVLKETLRMIPPLPNFLPREAIADHQLGDIKIDAGTIVVAAGVTNSFDPEYHDEPEVFKPERWLDENSKTRKSVSKNAYIYIPFSTGARTCPGKEIGNNLVRIVLGLFVKKFNYSLADKKYVMAFSAKLFSEPAEPLIYAVEPRN